MWRNARRSLAFFFSAEPAKSVGRSWYALSARRILRSAHRLPEIREVRSLTEDIAHIEPVVSDLDFFLCLADDSSVDNVGRVGTCFSTLTQKYWVLGEVAALDPRLERLVERHRATPLFWRDWPNCADLGYPARIGLGIHFLTDAWRRWLVFDGRRDSIFHRRAISRSILKGIKALENRVPESVEPAEGMAELFRALSTQSRNCGFPPGSLKLASPEPSVVGLTVWRAQAEAWDKFVGLGSPDPRWLIPGVMETDEGGTADFWNHYHQRAHRGPEWTRRLAPLPLPPSAGGHLMSGWTGWTDLDFSNTLFRAAAWRAAQPLPAEWNLSAAAALRDRVLSRLCLWLGFLCRGGGPESFDLTPAIRAMETLYPGCTRDPENKPSGHCWRKGEVIQWMRWAMERIDKD